MFIYLLITPEILKKARRNSNRDSPIGLALQEAGIDKFTVAATRAVIQIGNVVYESKFRGVFRKFQDDYRAGKPLSPIEGDLWFFPLSEVQKEIRNHIDERVNRHSERTEV